MIDRDTALGHHLFKITQTERVGDLPPHAQQHHIERIVEALQDPGDARSKRLSRCLRFLHRAAKVYLSAANTTSPALARQNPVLPPRRATTLRFSERRLPLRRFPARTCRRSLLD